MVYPQADIDAVPQNLVETLEEEINAFYEALESTREDMQRLSRRMKSVVAEEEHALFDVYIRILDKDSLGTEVEQVIRNEKIGAQAALANVIKNILLNLKIWKIPIFVSEQVISVI